MLDSRLIHAVPVSFLPPIDARAERLSRAFVWGTWAVASAAAVAYVLHYASNVPWMDDWELVPWLTGAREVRPGWLWRHQNDHRYPLTKLALVGLSRLTGGDYRAAMIACALALSAAAFACIRVAARLRGRTAWTDAFFPLAMLHWGHAPNLLHHIQLLFVSAAGLGVAFTLGVAAGWWRRSLAGAAVLGAVLMLLPLHGIMGLALTPPFVAAAACAGAAGLRSRSERPHGLVLLGAALAAVLLSAAYLVGFRRATMPAPGSTLDVWRTGLEVLAASFGPPGAALWPASAAALTGLYAITVALAARALWRLPPARVEAAGLLAALAGGFGVAAAIALGRAGFGPGRGLEERYAVLLLPMLAAVYLCWLLFGGRARPASHAFLFIVASVAFAVGIAHGSRFGRQRRAQGDALRRDLRAGLPPGLLAARHGASLYPSLPRLAARLELLRQAGHGPYRAQPAPPAAGPCAEWTPGALRVVATRDMAWTEGVGRVTGFEPSAVLSLPSEKPLCAVRLTLRQTASTQRPPRLRLSWRAAGGGDAGAEHALSVRLAAAGERQAVVAWVDGRVDRLRITPDRRTRSVCVDGVELLAYR
jgi:hypothetical protein